MPGRHHAYSKIGVHEIGQNAQRKCTDVWAFVVFLVCWVLMIVLGVSAYSHSNLKAFIYGVDYMGNQCGGSLPQDVYQLNAQEWSQRQFLWYPISYSITTNQFHLSQALLTGVCVTSCPAVGESVPTYSAPASSWNVPPQYTVQVSSTSVVMGRCVPDFLTFNCSSSTACIDQLAAQSSHFATSVGIGGFFTSGIETLRAHWGLLVGLGVLTIVLSFVWLFALRILVKPIVAVTCLGVVAAGIAGGAFMYHLSLTSSSGSDVAHWYLAGAIAAWIVTFLFICLLVFLFKDLNTACEIIIESSKVPVEMPRTAIVPVVSALFMVLFALLLGSIAVAIHTSGSYEPELFQDAERNTTVQAVRFAANNWRGIALFYDLFMFLWTIGFLGAIAHMIIGMCAVLWYWSTPGEKKEPPSSALSWSTKTTFRYHIGTVALGSFLIALVQFLRILMRMFERRLRGIAERNVAAKVVLCCANCCLSCFERVVALLTKNAYVMTAMTGEGLFPAARQALSLLLSNRAAIAVNILGEAILIVGKVLITAVIVLITWASVPNNSDQSNLLFCIVMALTAYFVASVFASVFSVCIDAVLLSYCVDKEENNGADRPYYFPESLSRHVEDAQRRRDGSGAEKGGANHSYQSRRDSTTSDTRLSENSVGYRHI